ncbi:MAG: hypothetical protein WD512_04345 [Candidatus Paceibacterota bacterium]
MPGKRLASAAKRVLLLNGPEIWFEIFRHIHGSKTLLKFRLVCKTWAYQMLFLNKRQYIMFSILPKTVTTPYKCQICDSIYPLILYLRNEWTRSRRGEKKIVDHILPNQGNMVKLLPIFSIKKIIY